MDEAAAPGAAIAASRESSSGAEAIASHEQTADTARVPQSPVASDTIADGVGGPADGADAALSAVAETSDPAPVAGDAAAAESPSDSPAAYNPPANWKIADQEMFRRLPEDAQRFVLARHKAMEADHTRKTQAVAELKREYEPVEEVFAPYRELMRTRGLSARDLIEGWVNVERRLAEGDGINVIKGLVAGYKLEPAAVVRALGVTAPEAASAGEDAAPAHAVASAAVPPEILQEIARLRQRADAEDRARAEAASAAQMAMREKFIADMEELKNATDDNGNLRHPYVAEVAEDMAHLALAAKSRGQDIPPLVELYERAVRANPSTYRAQRIAEAQSAERTRQVEARAKAAAARRAAASVTGAPGPGQPPTVRPSGRSLREELEAAADEAA